MNALPASFASSFMRCVTRHTRVRTCCLFGLLGDQGSRQDQTPLPLRPPPATLLLSVNGVVFLPRLPSSFAALVGPGLAQPSVPGGARAGVGMLLPLPYIQETLGDEATIVFQSFSWSFAASCVLLARRGRTRDDTHSGRRGRGARERRQRSRSSRPRRSPTLTPCPSPRDMCRL